MIEALGRYELLRMLGRGGMAEVYLARRRVAGLEKRLVVKRIRRERAGDPAILDLFMREARLSMSLGHQNVVPVFDFGRVGDDAFLAMEYVDGRDLAATLARAGRPVPPLLAAYIASECCRALDHAHHRRAPDGSAAGIIHRDVTPRNVLVSWAGEVKLADFGVATLAGDGDDRVRGTWAYMAPEQARGEPIDGRADLYALGLVLWSMLAGARARPGDDPEVLRALACKGELPEPPAVVAALRDVVVRATRPAPGDRYPDAREMQEALDAYLMAARAEAPGPPPERRLASWLAEVWGEDERRADVGVDAGGEVLTIDRTQRSSAATVADGTAAGDDALAQGGERVTASGASETSDGARGMIGVRDASVTPPTSRGRRSMLRFNLLAGALLVAAALVVAQRWRTDDATPVHDAEVRPGATTTPPTPPPATSPLAPTPGPAIGPGSGAPPIAGDPPPRTNRRVTAPAPHEPITPPARAPTGPVRDRPAEQPAPAPRKVTIGATPWADFYVDDDPTPHETPETLALPPGPHRIRLRNPTLGVERTITIDVPTDRDVRHVEHLEPR